MTTSDATCWDKAVFDELAAMLGPRAQQLLGRFRDDLSGRFTDLEDRDRVRRDAHALTSSAGMLGFRALASAASAVEIACRNSGDVSGPLRSLLQHRATAIETLARRAAG